jgi:bifunctional UDP-N-acetylglucosamine pyrophosphorylase/glucosamine-1-phosphate N-acetyltransferase
MALDVIILAAGQGSRMKSGRAKVLQEIAGKPMLEHVLRTARGLDADSIAIVVGHQKESVKATLDASSGPDLTWVDQNKRLGTGHAVRLALEELATKNSVIILYGDVPLLGINSLKACIQEADRGHLAVLVAEISEPAGLGRIIRDSNGSVSGIVEEKDASPEQRVSHEVNTGIIAAPGALLMELILKIDNKNSQSEYYLTDVVAEAYQRGVSVAGVMAENEFEIKGINDMAQLAQAERSFQRMQANEYMLSGLRLADPERIDIRGSLKFGKDCFLDVNVVIKGDVVLGNNVRVGPGSIIENSHLGDNCDVNAHTLVDGAMVEEGCSLGPFARIRPGSQLAKGVKVGNFVETKETRLGENSKASHLAYLGDAIIGDNVNIGAGTVTCNYDGVEKHKTTIGDRAFVGTNSTLVAPLDLGEGSFIGAGSTVTKDVGLGQLAIGRGKQRNIDGWFRPGSKSD